MKRLAIFASGSGTNAENLIRYFRKSDEFCVSIVLCNRKDAFVLKRAEKLGVPSVVFSKDDLYNGNVSYILEKNNIYAVILAGFLMMVPTPIIEKYRGLIINIHPALLPLYGGKGMHGMHVHEAVVAAGEKESGITIHLVDEQYDHGKTLFQAKCEILPEDTADDVASKIHILEQMHFPIVVEEYLRSITQEINETEK